MNDAANRYKSLAAKGAHIELLCLMWSEASTEKPFGVLDYDPGIARALGITLPEWLELRAELVDGPTPVFVIEDGRLVSMRLREEWENALDRSDKARESVSHRKKRGGASTDEPPFIGRASTDGTNDERQGVRGAYEPATTKQGSVSSEHGTGDPDPRTTTTRARARVDTRTPLQRLDEAWFANIGGTLTKTTRDDLLAYLEPDAGRGTPAVTMDVIELALREAHDHGVKTLRYVQGVLNGAVKRGAITREAWDACEAERQRDKTRRDARASPAAAAVMKLPDAKTSRYADLADRPEEVADHGNDG